MNVIKCRDTGCIVGTLHSTRWRLGKVAEQTRWGKDKDGGGGVFGGVLFLLDEQNKRLCAWGHLCMTETRLWLLKLLHTSITRKSMEKEKPCKYCPNLSEPAIFKWGSFGIMSITSIIFCSAPEPMARLWNFMTSAFSEWEKQQP